MIRLEAPRGQYELVKKGSKQTGGTGDHLTAGQLVAAGGLYRKGNADTGGARNEERWKEKGLMGMTIC